MRLTLPVLLALSCLGLSAGTVKLLLNPVSGQTTTLGTVRRENCTGILTVVADGRDKGTLSAGGTSLDLGGGKDFELRTSPREGTKQDMVLELVSSSGATYRFRLQDETITQLGWIDPTNPGEDVLSVTGSSQKVKTLTVKFPKPKS